MTISRIVMVLTLIALAIVVYFTMNSCETFNNIKNINNSESFTNKIDTVPYKETFVDGVDDKVSGAPPFLTAPAPSEIYKSYPADIVPPEFTPSEVIPNDYATVPANFNGGINYGETSKPEADAPRQPSLLDNMMKNGSDMLEGNYAPISQIKGPSMSATTDEDVNDIYVKMEGTDFLSAPLADRMYFTNSIANVNRNASQDVRGDIPITYNTSYTPFNQSSIYGEPMTINRLGDKPVTFSSNLPPA